MIIYKTTNLINGKIYKASGGWNNGISPSEETRKKMSLAKKGKVPWNKGLKLSEKEKKRIRELKTKK